MKNVKQIIYPLIIVWSVLAGYFAFSDLQISNSIVNPNAGWAVFLELYGELPGAFIVLSGLIIYIVNYSSSSLIKRISVITLFQIGSTAV